MGGVRLAALPAVPAALAWGLALLAGGLAWLVAAALAGGIARLLDRGGMTALNHRGRPVPQGAGLVLPLAHLAGTGVLLLGRALPPAAVWPGLAGCFALGLAGVVDDAAGTGEPKGWLGHGRALLAGRLTAGALKALTGLGLAVLIGLGAGGGAAGAAALAMGPNLVNTVDTRPGRALLLLLLSAGALLAVAGPGAVAPLLPMLGAALGLWPAERREELMWGDAGANAAGFALAWSWAAAGPAPALGFALAAAAAVVLGDRIHLGMSLPPPGRSRGRHG
jgi:hypothetical protein